MKLLTDEQIDRIYRSVLDRSGESVSELDYVKALLEAQAILTQGETLKEVGEWLSTHPHRYTCLDDVTVAQGEITILKRGEMPK